MATISLPYGFEPRPYQRKLWYALEDGYKRVVEIAHRRWGKDLCMLNWCAVAMHQRPGIYWHVLPTYRQGRKVIWEGRDRDGRKFLDYFPEELIERKRDDEMSIWFKNGALYQVIGADEPDRLVGANPFGVVFSEWALMDPKVWEFLRPILVENGGWSVFITTPRGRNHAYRMLKSAEDDPEWFAEVSSVDKTGAVAEAAIEAERRAGMPEELIQQEFYCLEPSALIYTASGQKEIADVQAGDMVLSHAGRWRQVTDVMSRSYLRDMVEIKSYGEFGRPLRLTPEHRVRVLDPVTQRYDWVPAGQIKPDQYMVMPRLKLGRPVVSEPIAALIAWYLCEGSHAKTAVQFSLGGHESEYIREIESCLEDYGCRWTRSEMGSVTHVIAHSTQLSDLLSVSCGKGASGKRMPWTLVAGHERLVFERMMAGDGCVTKDGWSYATVSHDLARDVQLLASSLGLRAGITATPARQATIEGRRVDCQPCYAVQIRQPPTEKRVAHLRPAKHGVGARVRSVRRVPGPARVYNLSVQFDQSYVAEGRVVHNCAFEAPAQGSYYGDILAELSAQDRFKHVPWNSDLPVVTGWDLGMDDATAIWFAQRVGSEVHLIDYYESQGLELGAYAQVVQAKPYVYADHIGPHDLAVREMGTGKTRLETLHRLGIKIRALPKTDFQDGIHAVRAFLRLCWFDEERCDRGIESLREYVKRQIPGAEGPDGEPLYSRDPIRNWATHGADSFRSLAMGFRRAARRDPLPPTRIAMV